MERGLCAPQTRQVQELQKLARGIGQTATLSSVLAKGVLPDEAIVILDEAGQVGTLDFARLVRLVTLVKGRVILSGDSQQHGSVADGDMLRLLENYSGCNVAHLTEINRQQDELYKIAVQKLSCHQTLAAWDLLDAAGKIEEMEEDQRREELARWVVQGEETGKNMLTVAPTWREIDYVTSAIRNELSNRGKLGKEARNFVVSERVDMTQSQKLQTRFYTVGMELIRKPNWKACCKRFQVVKIDGDHLILTEKSGGPETVLDLSKRPRIDWTVHRPREIEVRIGDRLLLQANERPKGYVNGDRVTVIEFRNDEIVVQGEETKVLSAAYTQWTYGWAVTSFRSQGLTCDAVAISYDQNCYGGIDRRGVYVAASRGKEDLRFFVDDKNFMRDCLASKTGERTTATELVKETSLIEMMQHRRRLAQIIPPTECYSSAKASLEPRKQPDQKLQR